MINKLSYYKSINEHNNAYRHEQTQKLRYGVVEDWRNQRDKFLSSLQQKEKEGAGLFSDDTIYSFVCSLKHNLLVVDVVAELFERNSEGEPLFTMMITTQWKIFKWSTMMTTVIRVANDARELSAKSAMLDFDKLSAMSAMLDFDINGQRSAASNVRMMKITLDENPT